MGHKTVSMTLRYSHLSPAHQLDAVQRLNSKPSTGTTTDTSTQKAKEAVGAGAEVLEMPGKESAPGEIRTPDLLVRSQPL